MRKSVLFLQKCETVLARAWQDHKLCGNFQHSGPMANKRKIGEDTVFPPVELCNVQPLLKKAHVSKFTTPTKTTNKTKEHPYFGTDDMIPVHLLKVPHQYGPTTFVFLHPNDDWEDVLSNTADFCFEANAKISTVQYSLDRMITEYFIICVLSKNDQDWISFIKNIRKFVRIIFP